MQKCCFLANLRSEEIREFHDLQTERNRRRNITGSQRISGMRSNGRVGRSCTFSEGDCDVRVRVFSVVTIFDDEIIINLDMSTAVA